MGFNTAFKGLITHSDNFPFNHLLQTSTLLEHLYLLYTNTAPQVHITT